VVLWLVSACVSDPAVEADVPASPGAVQPGGNGGSQVAAAEACTRIKAARTAAADKLGCDDPGDECPRYLYVAGAMPCDEYAGDSLDACEVVIGKYESCADLSARPCVVTPVAATCHKPAPPAASDAGDSS
jgi:hypothetical protein